MGHLFFLRVSVLAVAVQRRPGLLVVLGQGTADSACAGQGAALAPSGAKHQAVGDRAEPSQSFDAFGHEVDLVVAADLADRDLRVRIGVEVRVAGVASGERLALTQVVCGLGEEGLAGEDGSRRSFARGGYGSLKAAQTDLDHVRALLGLADPGDPEGTELIAELLAEVSRERSPLPEVEETRRRLNSGQDLIGSLTVAECLDRWLAGKRIRKSGLNRYETDIRVTGPATRQHIKATVRAALNDAIGQQIITFNPAAHVEIDPVRKPKALVWTDERVAKWEQTGEKPSPVMFWTPQQTGAFLDFVAEDRLYAMWHLIAFRGLRRGEACGQPWSETNLDTHSLTVSSQLV